MPTARRCLRLVPNIPVFTNALRLRPWSSLILQPALRHRAIFADNREHDVGKPLTRGFNRDKIAITPPAVSAQAASKAAASMGLEGIRPKRCTIDEVASAHDLFPKQQPIVIERWPPVVIAGKTCAAVFCPRRVASLSASAIPENSRPSWSSMTTWPRLM